MNYVKFKDVAYFNTGKLNSNAAKKNGKYTFFTCAPEPLKTDTYSFDKEAILLAGNNADGNFHINLYNGKFDAYQRTYVIDVIDKTKLNLRYLYYVLKMNLLHLKSISRGTSTKFLTATIINDFDIPYPSIDIQNKIAKILYDIDEKIEINNSINKNLQEIINKIFINTFVDYSKYEGNFKETIVGNIPSNWDVKKFGDIISFSNGYGWNSKDMLNTEENDTYKVFKMGNIKIGGGINKEKTKSWISKDKCSGLEHYLSKKGDILMCMTDMKSSENPLLGHTAVIDKDNEFVINQRVGLIRCDKELSWSFVYTMTNLPFFINKIRSKAHSGVQVNLTTSGICDTEVVVPDKESLNYFDNIVVPMYEKMFEIYSEQEKLLKIGELLLPKLMNGEIDLDKSNF